MIYFDHASSTKPFKEVEDFLRDAYSGNFFNPVASHKEGKKIKEKIESLKSFFLYEILKCTSGRFITTFSATIANNLVLLGLRLLEEDEVLYFSGDHPSLVLPVEKRKAKKIDVNFFEENFDLSLYLTAKTKLIVVSAVNNQSGQIAPIERIVEAIQKCNSKIHLHVDASQAFGKVQIDYQNIDSITFSGHKMGGVKGSAGLYLGNEVELDPIFWGGNQQDGFNPGTEDVVALEAFVLAAKFAKIKNRDYQKKILELSEYLKTEIRKIDSRIEFPFMHSSPYITTFIIPYFASDVFLRLMEEKGVVLSSTSACSSKIKGFNPTFKSLGIKDEYHKHVIRLSFGYETTKMEVDELLHVMKVVHSENAFLIKKSKR